MLLDVGCLVDNVLPPFQGEKRVVFLAILAVARMVIWTTRKKGLYDDANYFKRKLTWVSMYFLFMGHTLEIKTKIKTKEFISRSLVTVKFQSPISRIILNI